MRISVFFSSAVKDTSVHVTRNREAIPQTQKIKVDRAEFVAWRSLHALGNLAFNRNCLNNCTLYSQHRSPIIMCGGKEQDPFFSCRPHPPMNSSCGRTCPIHVLQSQWRCAENRKADDRIWWCPVCFPG